MAIQFPVKTDPETCWMVTRNGMTPIIKVEVLETLNGNTIYIDGVSRKDGRLNGGIRITPDVMDQLAVQWLIARYPELDLHLTEVTHVRDS